MATLASDGTRMPVGALGRETVCWSPDAYPTYMHFRGFISYPALALLTKLPSVSVVNLSAQFHPTEASAGTSETALWLKSKQIWKFAHVDVAHIEYRYAGNGQKGSFNDTKVILC